LNKRNIGTQNEEKAISYLLNQNVKIIHKNYRSKNGEVDIIGNHNGFLVFFEVKYRATAKSGYGAEAVDYKKQKIICKVADYYRYSNHINDYTPIRYDVISIMGEKIDWYQNAFYHIF